MLPLDNFSANPGGRVLRQRPPGRLTSTLAQISALRVIARISVERYRENRPLATAIASELGVDYLMHDITHPAHEPSGRFLLRVSPGLHASLRRAAADAGLSLNEYCARKVAAPGTTVAGPGPDVVARAAAQFGEALLGVLVFGSWARGEAADASDVDLLVVLDPDVAIVRSLYRAWDGNAEQPTWDGRRIEVHFVHPPEAGATPTGLWSEAALDGVVLFERGFELSRRLSEVRRGIAAGATRRRRVHGQPYWVGGG